MDWRKDTGSLIREARLPYPASVAKVVILLIRCNVEDPPYIQRSRRPGNSLISSLPKSNSQGPLDSEKYFLDDLIAEEKSLLEWGREENLSYEQMARLFVKKFQRPTTARAVEARLNRLKHTKQEMAEVGSTFSVPSCFLASDREQSQKAGQEGHRGQDGEGNTEG